MQNSAISFSVCINQHETRVDELIKELALNYEVKLNQRVELFTINHFKTQEIPEFVSNKNVLLEQKTRNTIQWVISADNGFLSMLNDSWDNIYKVNSSWFDVNDLSPEKNVFTKIAANILSGVDVNTFAEPTTPKLQFDSLKPVITDSQIRATIVHVDGYDNAVTNLNKETFFNWVGESTYEIFYRKRESLSKVEANYAYATPGNGVAVFNDVGWLEIAINKGEGRTLLGLKLGDHIIIDRKND
jgi:S-adenosylmethionine hydrolase